MQQYPLVVIVGGSGFVGRHTVRRFTDAGWRVRVLSRDTVAAEFVKTAGYPGQVVPDYADITRPETLAGKFEGANAVVNLVGVLYSRGRQSFKKVHEEGARAVAAEAAKAGVPVLVHLSALSAGISEAAYAKSKKTGEDAVRGVFQRATILRPSLVVGPEDGFFQRFGRMSLVAPFLPLIGGGRTRFQPLLVTDLVEAIFRSATQPALAGRTFELGGPEVFTFRQLLERLNSFTKRRTRLLTLPAPLAKLGGFFCELAPIPPAITRDQVRLLKSDAIVRDGADGCAALGIAPRPIGELLPEYLARFVKA